MFSILPAMFSTLPAMFSTLPAMFNTLPAMEVAARQLFLSSMAATRELAEAERWRLAEVITYHIW